MLEGMLIGLLIGVSFAPLGYVAQWAKGESADEWEDLISGLVVGSFVVGPPVILAWCTSHNGEWLFATIVTWTVLALCSQASGTGQEDYEGQAVGRVVRVTDQEPVFLDAQINQ